MGIFEQSEKIVHNSALRTLHLLCSLHFFLPMFYQMKPLNKKLIPAVAALILLFAAISGFAVVIYRNNRVCTAEDLGFSDLVSPHDADGDGIDDYRDMVEGARAYIATNPLYESAYYAGGYPTDGKGVCTDVIWQAFMAAGYNLKDMVDIDIALNTSDYFSPGEIPDPNIDFRRVRNLLVFFRNAVFVDELTVSTRDPRDWMPGDIVIYDGHIAICSDKRNGFGLPYIIHHGNPADGAVEANELTTTGYGKIIAHFRFKPN